MRRTFGSRHVVFRLIHPPDSTGVVVLPGYMLPLAATVPILGAEEQTLAPRRQLPNQIDKAASLTASTPFIKPKRSCSRREADPGASNHYHNGSFAYLQVVHQRKTLASPPSLRISTPSTSKTRQSPKDGGLPRPTHGSSASMMQPFAAPSANRHDAHPRCPPTAEVHPSISSPGTLPGSSYPSTQPARMDQWFRRPNPWPRMSLLWRCPRPVAKASWLKTARGPPPVLEAFASAVLLPNPRDFDPKLDPKLDPQVHPLLELVVSLD
jgi:hypothetical protein